MSTVYSYSLLDPLLNYLDSPWLAGSMSVKVCRLRIESKPKIIGRVQTLATLSKLDGNWIYLSKWNIISPVKQNDLDLKSLAITCISHRESFYSLHPKTPMLAKHLTS